jgi:hypothetical protein
MRLLTSGKEDSHPSFQQRRLETQNTKQEEFAKKKDTKTETQILPVWPSGHLP